MIQTVIETHTFSGGNTSVGVANNTTSFDGMKDRLGSIAHVVSGAGELVGSNYQTGDVICTTNILNGGLRSKITVSGATLSAVLKVRDQTNNAGYWAFVNSTLLQTIATAGGTAGSFPSAKRTFSNGSYIMELSAQQINTTTTTVTAKMLDATTSAVLDMFAYIDNTAGLLNSSAAGFSALQTTTVDDVTFFTTPAVGTDKINLVCEGHSFVEGTGTSGGNSVWAAQTAKFLGGTPGSVVSGKQPFGDYVVLQNFGHSGDTIADITTQYTTSVKTAFDSTVGTRNVLLIWIGTNDLFFGRTSAQVLTDLQAYCVQAMADHPWDAILLMPIYDRGDASWTGAMTTSATAVNAGLLSAEGTWFSKLAPADNRFIPGSGQSASTTWFNGDHIHPNDDGAMQAAIYASEMARDYIYLHPPTPPSLYSFKPSMQMVA